MKVAFSFNLCDEDGDIYEEYLMLHVDDNIILKLKNMDDLDSLINQLNNIRNEIKENYEKST